jgi:hypothetical protein
MKNLIYYLALIFMTVLLYSPGYEAASNKNAVCDVIGPCRTCHSVELDAEYCRDTGKRVKIHCKDDENEYDYYKSCNTTSDDDQFNVIVFQIAMAIIGGLAYWGVQNRKKNNMTLFDVRRQR